MANYVLVYTGGGVPETEEERKSVMDAWTAWYGSLGESIVDGGNPFGASKGVASDGSVTDGGAAGLTGYTVITAGSLDAAAEAAKGCPILSAGGGVQVYETFEVM